MGVLCSYEARIGKEVKDNKGGKGGREDARVSSPCFFDRIDVK